MALDPFKLAPKAAIKFFRGKDGVFMPTRTYRDMAGEMHGHAFMVAGATKVDMLRDFYDAVNRAITKGSSIGAFRKDFDDIGGRYGWDYTGGRAWRTRAIYDTNMTVAYQAARYQAMTDPDVLEDKPYWEYRIGFAQHHRPDHMALNGTILPADDAFWAEAWPPNGWGCHCWVKALTAEVAKALGISDKAPAFIPQDGWGHSAGKAWEDGFEDVMKRKLGDTPAPLREAFLDSLPDEQRRAFER